MGVPAARAQQQHARQLSPTPSPTGLLAGVSLCPGASNLQVLLMSRDEMSMLVVSYADVRRCIASCYEELRARAAGKQQQGGMQRSRSRASVQQQY